VKSKIIITVFLLPIIVGCAGRESNPVALHYPGDENRTCKSLQQEVAQNEVQIRKKLEKDKSKFWTNTAWFIVFTPAMDMKEAEKTEAEALQERNKVLRILMAEKDCPYLTDTEEKTESQKTEARSS